MKFCTWPREYGQTTCESCDTIFTPRLEPTDPPFGNHRLTLCPACFDSWRAQQDQMDECRTARRTARRTKQTEAPELERIRYLCWCDNLEECATWRAEHPELV